MPYIGLVCILFHVALCSSPFPRNSLRASLSTGLSTLLLPYCLTYCLVLHSPVFSSSRFFPPDSRAPGDWDSMQLTAPLPPPKPAYPQLQLNPFIRTANSIPQVVPHGCRSKGVKFQHKHNVQHQTFNLNFNIEFNMKFNFNFKTSIRVAHRTWSVTMDPIVPDKAVPNLVLVCVPHPNHQI